MIQEIKEMTMEILNDVKEEYFSAYTNDMDDEKKRDAFIKKNTLVGVFERLSRQLTDIEFNERQFANTDRQIAMLEKSENKGE